MTTGTSRRPSRETVRVLALACGLVLVALALGAGRHVTTGVPELGLRLPWWAMAAGFAATESAILHVQTRREAQTVSISELPLVVGLFFASPTALLLGRVAGSLAVFVGQRRSTLKTTFNTALVATETVVSLTVFHAVAGSFHSVEPRQWVAALAAAMVANAVGSVAIGLVIGIYEGGSDVRSLLTEAVTGQAFAPAVVVLALVAVSCMASGGSDMWLVAASAVVLTACYRLYTALFDRHVNLERLYEFSQGVTSSSDNGDVVKRVLDEAKQLLTSDHARLVVGAPDDRVRSVCIVLDQNGEPARTTTGRRTPTDWLEEQVIGAGRSVLMPRRSRDRRVRTWLRAHDVRDAIAVPLRGTDRIIGMLVVGERLGEVRTYGREDVILLETLANHASVALQKGQLIEQLQHDALHDGLTGLPNRAHLQRRLAEALDASAVSGDPVAVMILDLDGFKDVNDTLGHHEGDVVLTQVAARLVHAVSGEGFVARLGGDEFAVLLPRVHGWETALQVAERVVSGLQAPMRLQGMQFEVGASVGVAMAPEDGRDGSVLMKRADIAMYEAKTSGVRVCQYSPDNDTNSSRRLALAGELRSALSGGAVEVHVQPQADARTGRVRSVEALARWRHPDLGVVPPAEFVPVAERSGAIGPLTMAVIDESLRAVNAWAEHGVSVAVNISPRSLLNPSFFADVEAALERWRVPPWMLTLEVTEGAVMTDPDRAIALLDRFKEMGVRLSIDDFGTGYSSLSYLKRLPVHEVKIDRSFVTGLATSSQDHAIVRSIISLGMNLGLEIVAEGVEDQETYDLLAAMGCTKIQGWHVARPMSVDAATEWLAHRGAGAATAVGGR